MMYSICHNDDDPRDPSHRRVVINIIKHEDGFYAMVVDGEVCARYRSQSQVVRDIWQLWSDPVWDLHEVAP